MNEQEARELLDGLTREELIEVCVWLEWRQHNHEVQQFPPK